MRHPHQSVDEILPARKMITLGLQHMLVAYVGAIAVPLIVASALKMSHQDTITLISTALFCSGIATLVQTIGVWKFGVKLPILNGVAFSSVGPVIAIGTNPQIGFVGVCGSVIAAGLVTIVLAPYVGKLRRFFPPVVTGCIVLIIGLTLFPVAYQWLGGGRGNAQFGSPVYLAVAFFVTAVILGINRYATGLVRNLSVLIGLLCGALAGGMLGMADYSSVAKAPWVAVPMPFHFGIPVFRVIPILTMIVVMLVQMVESTGLFIVIGDIANKEIHEQDVINGLRGNGLASAIAGMFAAFPFIAFMENVGTVILTGVRSRFVVAVSGVLLCLVALMPKIGAVFAATAPAALGGTGMALFGVVVAAGIKTLSRVDYTNENNVYVVGFTLVLAAIPIFMPSVFGRMPKWTAPFLQSGVIIASVAAVALNLFFNGLREAVPETHALRAELADASCDA